MAKWLMLTASSESYSDLASVTLPPKAEYAARWGMELWHKRHSPNPKDIPMERLVFARDALQHCDVLFWTGADATITNQHRDCRPFLPPGRSMAIGIDWYGINNDVWFMRSCWETWNLLSFVMDRYDSFYSKLGFKEQQGFMDYLNPQPEWCDFYPGKAFNAYINRLYEREDPSTEWAPGDFILHVPACPNDKRIMLFEQILNQVKGTL